MPDAAPGPRWPIWSLAILFVLIEALLILGADTAFGIPRLRATAINFGAFYPGILRDGVSNFLGQGWTMFLTHGLLHAGIAHLFVNVVTLFSLAPAVLDRVGTGKFWLLWIGSQIGGGLGALVLGASWAPVVGASGALFGLAGAIVAWEYADRFISRDRLWPVARAVLLLLALNVVIWWVLDGRLAWHTHLGGFVAGWVLAFLIDPLPRAYDP